MFSHRKDKDHKKHHEDEDHDDAPIDITGWAAMSPGEDLQKLTYQSGKMELFDVDLEVTSCGICHSDIHLNAGDWPELSSFPQVSGHEVVGKVIKKGPLATHEIGDVVAVGWQCGSCGSCEYCTTGIENLCQDANKVKYTCGCGNKGGFADKWRGDSRFCFKVPAGLDPLVVGPLMCGGATMFNPLRKHTKAGDHVGILGVGGLGHIGVKLAKARGCHVTAIEYREDKRRAVLGMGADTFIASSSAEQLAAAANTLDCLIITIPVSVDWQPYIDMMRPNGKMVFVGAIPEPMSLPIWGPFIFKQITVVGSIIGSPPDINALLKFAAANPKCVPTIETMKFDQINEAMARVKNADVRFRMVLVP